MSPRVLIADDESDIRARVEIAVRRAGAQVLDSLPDGTAALAAAGRDLPDLVVLDVGMPGLDGLQVCTALRADTRTAAVPVLLLSAGASPADVERGLAAGADTYLLKPFRVSELADRIRELTGDPR